MEEKLKTPSNVSPLKNGVSKEGLAPGMSWKEWKQKRKENKLWKESKALKKQKKSEESVKRLQDKSLGDHKLVKDWTVSIAVPGSILDNAQSPELKTYLAGQIARAAAVFNIGEIIVFNDTPVASMVEEDDQSLKLHRKNHGSVQMIRILQFLECPQYLRKYYFPLHKDLEYAGLLNPLDIPHHLRVDEDSEYREGIVLNKPVKEGRGSFVYIGLKKTAIIDKILESNVRVTVKLDQEHCSKKHYKGIAVAPSMPYKESGIYWGYSVRHAKSIKNVFDESPFKGGYDLTIGTSDKGHNVDEFQMPPFKHLLIVFGGLKGLEACIESDETLDVDEPKNLFNFYLNTCPLQGSRTIRTEEAVLITLSALRPAMNKLENLKK
ncbi:putative methyltransferase C9orf114 [Uloborus diversus]|uniref:putative methyltransferase C9orf114 n=1 Tax=Uloborus diversus TaxID=327109 RepID=UPI00240A81E2|nr:putative methyltransferase C9orf114 [Uloborus diversus]